MRHAVRINNHTNNKTHMKVNNLPWFCHLLRHSARKRVGLVYATPILYSGQVEQEIRIMKLHSLCAIQIEALTLTLTLKTRK